MNCYFVCYKEHPASEEHGLHVFALNKEDAYDRAVFEEIPRIIGTLPYSAWVSCIKYGNGSTHYFNTHEGKPT